MDISLKIDGMHCGGCVKSVEKAAASIEGISNVTVVLESGLLSARLAHPQDEARLREAIEATGFDVTAA